MKRKTVRVGHSVLVVAKRQRANPIIIVHGAAQVIPPHKLRAFGKACIQIADEVRDER